jgi:hypothetical protein
VTATELVFANGRLTVSGTVVTVAASNTIHSGEGPPENSLGIDGDFYFDELDFFFYGPKVAGAWADEYVIMSGSSGAASQVTSVSSSSVAIETGSKIFTIPTSANRGWTVGMRLRAAFDFNNYVEGPITALASNTVTINVDLAVGSGTRTSWNIGIAGDRGATGAAGSDGSNGATGATGAAGSAATITVGTVSTGAAGSSATITNVGTSSAAVFNFAIPRGDTGATGATGSTGATGPQGPAGAAGPNSVSSSTTTTFAGLLAGNGSVVSVATLGAGLQFAAGQLSTSGVVLTTTTQSVGGVKTFTDALDLATEALADAATITVDAAAANKFDVTLGGNRTIANPTNPVDGRVIIFRLRQDANGSRLVTWGNDYRFRGDLAAANVTLSTSPTVVDRVAFEYVGADSKWDCISFIKGS